MRIIDDWLEDWISERTNVWQMIWFPSQAAYDSQRSTRVTR
ncbi:hypothetical protein [Neorhizobium sp. T25_13]|nr:hypothetical protein [Neorhizobium sp. T25_13]